MDFFGKVAGHFLRKKKKGIGCLVLCILPVVLLLMMIASGISAIWSFLTGLVGGDSRPDKVDLSNYTLEKLIECADDENVITDEYLKNMMIDRDSYKRLLEAVQDFNTNYDTDTKRIQYKHTYTTTTVTETENSDGEVETEIVKERHVAYVWRNMKVSTEGLEGQYKLYWQPVFTAVLQNFIYNYNDLIYLTESASKAESSSDVISGEAVTSQKTLGEKVIEYARKYIGNPYEYGGDSLTKGCDGGGFVMKVYQKFGYSLTQYTADQSVDGDYIGTSADESVMQLGDLVFYSADNSGIISHVGIYSGNGKIISALDEENGITECSIKKPGTVVMVRRIIGSDNIKSLSAIDDNDVIPVTFSVAADYTAQTMTYQPDGTDNLLFVAKKKDASSAEKEDNPYAGADKELVGNSNVARAWNFFKAKGLSDVAVASILGNFQQESGINPKSGYGTDGPYGIAQWLGSGRWKELKKKYPGHEWELLYQLKYAWLELNDKNSVQHSKALQTISQSQQLEWIADNNPGAVYYFALYFEGCTGTANPSFPKDRLNHDIQDYDNRLKYAQKILKSFGGKNGSITDGKIFTAGDTAFSDTGIKYGEPAQIGTFDATTGMVHLSDEDIEVIINDFKPKFEYLYDFVRDDKEKFSFKECQTMKNSGLKNNGGDPSTAYGLMEWYEPVSTLACVQLPYCDITYQDNVPVCYEMNPGRWKNIMSRYVAYYDDAWFRALVELLPNGSDPISEYEYYLALSNGKISSSSDSSITNASGQYTSMDNVKPSIKIPENAGGMSIPLYLQTDKRWSSIVFGGGNIGTSGCSVTSLAMVLSYLNDKCIYPDHVVAWTGNRFYAGSAGQSWSIFGAVAEHWGLKCTQQTANANAIRKALKAGKPVIVSTTGKGTTQEFTTGGHFIVLRGLTSDGKVLVNDPNDNSTTKMHYLKAYTAEFIVSECTENGSTVKAMWTFSK